MSALELHVYRDAADLARGAADRLASEIHWAQQLRGSASFAVSGGSTPLATLVALARHPIDWSRVHLFQVDERMAPDGDEARNATGLLHTLVEVAAIPADRVHLVPMGRDAEDSARQYAATVEALTGGVFDVVQLGIGADGHTASLIPGDAGERSDGITAATGTYMGHQRVTLTASVLAASRRIVWIVEGEAKAEALRGLVAADANIPAGRVPQDRAVVYCDEAAVRLLDPPR